MNLARAATGLTLTALALSACGQGGSAADVVQSPVVVPGLVGQPLERAERRLGALGLEVRARRRFSNRARGAVIVQRPPAGKRVPPRTAVALSVSRGPAPGPYGELRKTGVGPLEVGTSMRRVLETFGPPDRRFKRNLGVGPAPEVDWTWRLRGSDELKLHFDRVSRRLTGYCTDSSRLATGDGVRVGDVSVGMLARRYGDRVVPAPIGSNSYLLSARRAGTYPAFAFTFSERSALVLICGGRRPPAGD